jgi:holo-[acyl-carrier protein] synthase
MGIDIVEISRLARIVSRYGDRFVEKVYTPAEAVFCGGAGPAVAAARYAGRWAAKEAFYKALPAGVQRLASWRSVQTLPGASGRPSIEVCDARLRDALTGLGVTRIHLSISHERTHCVAVVALESL